MTVRTMTTKSETFETLLKRANEIYALKRIGEANLPYTAPELIPKIESRQVLSILEAVAEYLDKNKE